MRRVFRPAIIAAAMMMFTTVLSSAKWRIEIGSIEVPAGATDVTLDVTAYWDTDLENMAIPMIVRELDHGAFWTGELPYDTAGNGFFHPHQQGVEWKWARPWAGLLEIFRPAINNYRLEGQCLEPVDTSYDGISPDQFVIAAAGTGAPPNTAEPEGRVFLTFTFDVTDVGGRFEFDTACFSGGITSIYMIGSGFPFTNRGPTGTGEVTFGKGSVTILADSDGDGLYDHLDNCPNLSNNDQKDTDRDGVGDACDNCPTVDNPGQEDANRNGIGDACE